MTPPDALAGLALVTLAWLPLWWLAGGRQPLTWRGPLTAAAALAVLAAATGDVLFALLALSYAWSAARRWPDPPEPQWSNHPGRREERCE